jgi:hypothetical protein
MRSAAAPHAMQTMIHHQVSGDTQVSMRHERLSRGHTARLAHLASLSSLGKHEARAEGFLIRAKQLIQDERT